MSIDRFVIGSTEELVSGIIAFVLGFPRHHEVEALVVVNGQGELFRMREPIDKWNRGIASHLIITGAGIGEKTYRSLDRDDLVRNFGLTRLEDVHAQGYPTSDTRDQGRWIVEELARLRVKSAAVYASLYHLPRVFLTLLHYLVLWKLEREIVIHPRPSEVSPFEISPETGHTLFDLFPGEMRRITLYGGRGDIASLDECQTYLRWSWATLDSL